MTNRVAAPSSSGMVELRHRNALDHGTKDSDNAETDRIHEIEGAVIR
jgi:hypothetical protein